MAELSEVNRTKLDGIVQQMVKNGEPEEGIRSVVEDFKQKYGESQSLTSKALAYAKSLPNPLTFHPNYGPNISDVDTGPSYDLMKYAAPGTLAMRGMEAFRAARAARAAAASGAAGTTPYFRERTTYDPQFRGPVSPSGTVYPPGYGFPEPTAAPAASGVPAASAAPPGVDPVAFGKLPPEMQAAITKRAGLRATASGGYTPPPAGSAPAVEGIPAPKPVHEAAHAIDTHFSPRKAMNLTRHLQEQGVPFEDVSAMVAKAKATGNWDAINALEKDAWTSGKALEASGAAKPGALVPKTPYRPKSADYSGIEGIENTEGTWDRVLKSYPRNIPKPKPPASEGIPAPQGIPVPAWGLQ